MKTEECWCLIPLEGSYQLYEPCYPTSKYRHSLHGLVRIIFDKKTSDWFLLAKKQSSDIFSIVAEGKGNGNFPTLEEASKARFKFMGLKTVA
jgi:hypothetical protein